LKIFRSWGSKETFSEKSVVRPTYSYLGDYTISDKAIADIIQYIGLKMEEVYSIIRVETKTSPAGLEITILVIMNYGCKVVEVAKTLQKRIAEGVERMTAFNVEAVNIEIRGLK